MDKFESMRAFVQVVEAEGFAAAARNMGLSRSQVNKLVANLEAHLSVRLLHRTTRKVTPTDTGRAYYERCLNILAELEETEATITQLQTEVKGILRINAPMSFGMRHLGDAIATFSHQHPHLQVEVALNDRFIDPLAEGFDITLRISESPNSVSLISHHVMPTARVLCATPEYLARCGCPQVPSQLREHSCLHYGHLPGIHRWFLRGPQGDIVVPISGALCSNNGEVLRSATLKGIGISLLPTFIVEEDLQQEKLQVVLPEYRAPDIALSQILQHSL